MSPSLPIASLILSLSDTPAIPLFSPKSIKTDPPLVSSSPGWLFLTVLKVCTVKRKAVSVVQSFSRTFLIFAKVSWNECSLQTLRKMSQSHETVFSTDSSLFVKLSLMILPWNLSNYSVIDYGCLNIKYNCFLPMQQVLRLVSFCSIIFFYLRKLCWACTLFFCNVLLYIHIVTHTAADKNTYASPGTAPNRSLTHKFTDKSMFSE